jgi:hypothetical protein
MIIKKNNFIITAQKSIVKHSINLQIHPIKLQPIPMILQHL